MAVQKKSFKKNLRVYIHIYYVTVTCTRFVPWITPRCTSRSDQVISTSRRPIQEENMKFKGPPRGLNPTHMYINHIYSRLPIIYAFPSDFLNSAHVHDELHNCDILLLIFACTFSFPPAHYRLTPRKKTLHFASLAN